MSELNRTVWFINQMSAALPLQKHFHVWQDEEQAILGQHHRAIGSRQNDERRFTLGKDCVPNVLDV